LRLLVSLVALLLTPFAASAQVIHACVKNGGTIKIVADPVECGQGVGDREEVKDSGPLAARV
jgi:hypothetical protein